MRIAQVAPLFESVPPQQYGGTERVVAYLTDELVRQGHDVTLYATGDSHTRAKLVPITPRGLRLEADCRDPQAMELLTLDRVHRDADRYDVIHFHTSPVHYPASRHLRVPHVTTLHGPLDLHEQQRLYQAYDDVPVVSISHAQRRPAPEANWQANIYHGMPRDLCRFHPKPDGYLAFLGRICPEKRPDRAIEIAKRANLPLKIAAKVDPVDRRYYEEHIKPLLDHPLIQFLGEVNDESKTEFVGRARAMLLPVDWSEPFGLVMIESMACGTPVIAWDLGSIPEVMVDGVTGFVVNSIEAAVEAARRVDEIDRAGCRRVFEERYTVERMANEYVGLYHKLHRCGQTPAADSEDDHARAVRTQ
jgi:glycosyltransferase involved in cell wall biosynthesis